MSGTITRALRGAIWRCLITAGILAVLDLGMNGLTRGIYPRFGDNLALLGQSFTINLGFVTVLFVLTAVILTLGKRLTPGFRFWNNAKVASAAGAVTAAALIFVFVSVHVNTVFIHSSFSAAGLFANVVMFLTFFVFTLIIFWADGRTAHWRRRLFWRVGTGVLVAVMVVLAVAYVFFPQATKLVRPDPPVGTPNFVIVVLDARQIGH